VGRAGAHTRSHIRLDSGPPRKICDGWKYPDDLTNDRHIARLDYSLDGQTWERYDRGIEVSRYHHNVSGEFLSLKTGHLCGRAEGSAVS